MIQIDMPMPEKCGVCPCFHFDNPMYCQVVKADKSKNIVAPYGQKRPEWCPLKEQESQESDEKNKECVKDKIAVECLNAIQTINKYIDCEEDECGCSFWRDKKGYEFKADIDYFFEGLDNFEEYLKRRLGQAVKQDGR